jgi:pyroglutamyl-peptidase
MRHFGLAVLALAAPLVAGCSSDDSSSGRDVPAAEVARDALPDGLYRDFLDGKFDAAGHPLDAQVWEAESDCSAAVGENEAEGRAFRSGGAGLACSATSSPVGKGRFVLSARALAFDECAGAECDAAALTLVARGADGSVLEEKTFPRSAFPSPLTEANLALPFTHYDDGPVSFELKWEGQVGVRIDYVELFRATRNLLVTPPSGVLATGSSFSVEALDPPTGFSLEARCDDVDLTDTLASLLASGEATRDDTEFRSLFQIPAESLLAACPLPTRVRFSVMSGSWNLETVRVSVYAEEPPCAFTDGTTRVLLTGFEPFPASSTHDNSSEAAVSAFDPADVPGISAMKLTLPVEFDTAPGIVSSAIERCAPDVVIGFGQGRSRVDVETTAYNLEDSSEVAGGVPDNRGHIPGGVPIVSGGPAELSTGLPADAILAALGAAGIGSGLSDDPGRYVCNNVFYRIMTETAGTTRVSGFVHLPYIHTVDDADRQMLRNVVTKAVEAAVEKQRGN